HMGYTVLPPQDDMNGIAYYLMQNKQPKKAYQLFSLNIKNYPHSENAYDSMGDYYAAQKDKAKAIEYYTKAISIKETPATKKKLDSLQSKK
ncbi:MAG: tetratricopeptide repeat protein, partial [Mucilaginibacter sp.]